MGNKTKKKTATAAGSKKARQRKRPGGKPAKAAAKPGAQVRQLTPGMLGTVSSSGDKEVDGIVDRLLKTDPATVDDAVLSHLLKGWQPKAIAFGGVNQQVMQLKAQLKRAEEEAAKNSGGVQAVEAMIFDRVREMLEAGKILCDGCGTRFTEGHVTTEDGVVLCEACFKAAVPE